MIRLVGSLIAASVLVISTPALATSGAGGADHHVFNPSARIDHTQVEDRTIPAQVEMNTAILWGANPR